MSEVRIGVLGFGTVGAGVVEGILQNAELMEQRTGIRPVVTKIADLDITTDRGICVADGVLTTDASEVFDNPDIDVVVETIGGSTIAKTFTLKALNNGKPVVTANKKMLAEYGEEIFGAAKANKVGVYFEAAVGGGIPCCRALKDGLIGNRIKSIYGILNGTCNYILTRMEREGLDFDMVLADAQALGYAETPPDLDIDGIDTAHKAVLLASLAYGAPVSLESCKVQGIRGLDKREIEYADELGYRIKLLGVVKDHGGKYEVRVEPALVPQDSMIGSVMDVFNAVLVDGDIVDETLYYGKGAGRLPTGSAVIGDIMEAAMKLGAGQGEPVSDWIMLHDSLDMVAAEENEMRCYLRMSLKDQPDTLAKVAHVLGAQNISIASLIQKESRITGFVPVVILTHKAKESEFEAALETIKTLGVVNGNVVRLAIEDFE
jgi:homoserine dehydrogenase